MRVRKVDESALLFLSGKNTLLDSTMTMLCLTCEEGELILELHFSARSDAEYKFLKLRFSKIMEFGFYYSNRYSFYNVEAFKFLKTNDGAFYLSLDPDDNFSDASMDDQDFVKSANVELNFEG